MGGRKEGEMPPIQTEQPSAGSVFSFSHFFLFPSLFPFPSLPSCSSHYNHATPHSSCPLDAAVVFYSNHYPNRLATHPALPSTPSSPRLWGPLFCVPTACRHQPPPPESLSGLFVAAASSSTTTTSLSSVVVIIFITAPEAISPCWSGKKEEAEEARRGSFFSSFPSPPFLPPLPVIESCFCHRHSRKVGKGGRKRDSFPRHRASSTLDFLRSSFAPHPAGIFAYLFGLRVKKRRKGERQGWDRCRARRLLDASDVSKHCINEFLELFCRSINLWCIHKPRTPNK